MIDETAGHPDEGGSDYGSDLSRDLGDGPASSYRDTAPDVLAPIDADAPVSGHVPTAADAPPVVAGARARLGCGPGAPDAASPADRHGGVRLADVDRTALAMNPSSHTLPRAGRRPVRAAGRLRDPGGRLRCRGQRRAPRVVGRGAGRDRGGGAGQPGSLVGGRGLDRRGIGRSPAHLVGLPAPGRTPPESCCPRSGPSSPSGSGPAAGRSSSACPSGTCSWPASRPPAMPSSPSSWPASWPTMPTVPTSRSTGACSSWSATSCDRWPADNRWRRPSRALRWEVDSGVATITLDRPAALNSLEATLKADLLAALREAASRLDRPGRRPDRSRPGVLRRPGPEGTA